MQPVRVETGDQAIVKGTLKVQKAPKGKDLRNNVEQQPAVAGQFRSVSAFTQGCEPGSISSLKRSPPQVKTTAAGLHFFKFFFYLLLMPKAVVTSRCWLVGMVSKKPVLRMILGKRPCAPQGSR